MSDDISVEVAYALPHQQTLIALRVRPGATVFQVIEQSGILKKHPELDPDMLKVGIFAKPVKSDAMVRDKDRVEIYRPLIADPKEVRKKRAAEGKPPQKEQATEAA